METLQKKLGYIFKDIGLLLLAMTHKSMGRENNERLEFLGDSVLGLIVASFLYSEQPGLSEGQMASISSNLVSHKAMLAVARNLGLDRYLSYDESGTVKISLDGMISDATEALIGAIYLDGGIDICHEVTIRLIKNEVDKGTIKIGRDPKTLLQEYLQARHLPVPVYETEPTGSNIRCIATVDKVGKKCAAYGVTVKEAEMNAADFLLKHLRAINHDGGNVDSLLFLGSNHVFN